MYIRSIFEVLVPLFVFDYRGKFLFSLIKYEFMGNHLLNFLYEYIIPDESG